MEVDNGMVGDEASNEVILEEKAGAEGSSESDDECIDIEDYLYEEWRDRQWDKKGDEHAIADTDA